VCIYGAVCVCVVHMDTYEKAMRTCLDTDGCGVYVFWVYVLVCVCARGCTWYFCSGVYMHMLGGGEGDGECEREVAYTPLSWHSLKSTPVSQREFFVAKINFLI
jgi:hypothetical protein